MRQHLWLILLVLVLGLTVFAYLPGLSGQFMFDDYPNIVENQFLQITSLTPDALLQAAWSNGSGPLGRPLSMLSFALNFHFLGSDPSGFKVINLMIHLLSGLVIMGFASLVLCHYRRRWQTALNLTAIRWIAISTGALWLLHPVNLTPVLYVVQRMTGLATLFTLLGLTLYIHGRNRMLTTGAGPTQAIMAVLIFTPLASLAKENGALLPLLVLIVESTLYNFAVSHPGHRRYLVALPILTVLLPALLVLVYTLINPDFVLAGYQLRDFTLMERLITEPRVLWRYLGIILLPGLVRTGFYHDDIAVSHGLLDPVTTLPALLALLLLIGFGIGIRRRAPMAAFGVFFFLSAHALEAGVFPLELAFEHRNYLPTMGLFLALLYYLQLPLGQSLPLRHGTTVLLLILCAVSTTTRAIHWSNPLDQLSLELRNHPDSPRANYMMGALHGLLVISNPGQAQRHGEQATHYLRRALILRDNYIAPLISMIRLAGNRHEAVPTPLLVELQQRLSNQPLTANAVNSLENLVQCQRQGPCNLDHHIIESLLQATLNNPSLKSARLAKVYSTLAIYHATLSGDSQHAVEFARRAAITQPSRFSYQLDLIDLLIGLGQYETARTELARAYQLDTLGIYTNALEQREQRLSNSVSSFQQSLSGSS